MDRKEAVCSAWGWAKKGQLGKMEKPFSFSPQPLAEETVVSSACGENHSLIATEREVLAFGSNVFGQLGFGSEEHKGNSIPALEDRQVMQVSCGSEHSFAVTRRGDVYAWGLNFRGQLGLKDMDNRSKPTLVESISTSTQSS